MGGACINNSIVFGFPGDLVSQVNSGFAPHYSNKPESAPWTGDDAVFSFWIGINEYVSLFPFRSVSQVDSIGVTYRTPGAQARIPALLDSYFNEVDYILGVGGRRFLFLDVPPTTRSPRIIADGQTGAHAAFVAAYNSALALKIDGYKLNHPEVGHSLFFFCL